MQINQALDRWLEQKRREHKAPKTLSQYTQQTSPLRKQYGRKQVRSLTRPQLQDLIYDCGHFADGTEKSGSTRRVFIVCLENFLRWCVDQELLESIPLKSQDVKKPSLGMRTALPTDEQVRQIIQAASNPRWVQLYRCLRLTGCRPSELINADISHLDWQASPPTLLLHRHKTVRKTGLRRVVLSPPVAQLFRQVIGRRKAGPIFTTTKGQRWTVAYASQIFSRIRDSLQIDRGIVFYTARHEFATKVVERNGIMTAKELLGHTSITTTQRYAHPQAQHLAEAQAAAVEGLDVTGDQT